MAIVGAGLAGLACAHELERLGMLPVIFERQQSVGKPSLVVETMAQFMHHSPGQDIFEHLRQDLGLPVTPHAAIRRMLLHGPTHEAALTGHLGYTSLRGPDDRALERQLARRLAAEIRYGERPDVWELRQRFDWVVVATGTHEWSQTLAHWTPHIDWSVRGAVVEGAFDPTEQHFFLNTRYAKTGYAMISPVDERSAVVGVAVPDASGKEADHYWELFRQGESRHWEGEVQKVRIDHLQVGQPSAVIVGNVMLIGHAGGFCEPLAISGQCPSLASGVYAARQMLLGDRSLDRFNRHFRAYSKRIWRLRRNVNAWTDAEMDLLVRAVRYGGGLLATKRFNLLRPAGWLMDHLPMADDLSPEVGPR